MTASTTDRPILRVYAAPECLTYRITLRIVDAVRQARPTQPIEVVDLTDAPEQPLPPGVVGAPTYLLDARVISMGNPELAALLAQLDTASQPIDDE